MSKWRRRSIYILGVLALGCAVLEICTRLPASFAVRPLGLNGRPHALVLLFHGRYGEEEPSFLALTQRFQELAATRPGTAAVRYIWAPYSDWRFRVQVNGDRIGRALGRELAAQPQLEYIHLVSQSAGAYLLEPLCEAYRQAAPRPARIEMTYLDPIGFGGAFDLTYGVRHFGRCADYAEAVINTEDRVPTTNAPLENAWNRDVTGASGRAAYPGSGHRWPMQYYLNNLTAADLTPGLQNHRNRPRGAVGRE